jgi:hypothetical protein
MKTITSVLAAGLLAAGLVAPVTSHAQEAQQDPNPAPVTSTAQETPTDSSPVASAPNASAPAAKITLKSLAAQVATLQTQVNSIQSTVNAIQPPTFAVVNKNGTLARGSSNVVSTGHLLPTGQYEVIFNKNVTGCGYVATLGDPSTGVGTPGFITVASRLSNANGVFVETSSTTDASIDDSFYVTVTCP